MVSSILGGLFMLFFSYLTIKDALKANVEVKTNYEKYPLMVGIALSALNPFFILWWVTIGFTLVVEALNLWGYFGLIPLYVSHVWLDFAWLMLLAHITSLSGLSLRIYRAILFALGVAIGLFGIDFIYYGIFSKHLLPL
jgi:threonine/homoserine/homoserine lactone efflux protein